MKIYTVPVSLFVRGAIRQAYYLEEERDRLVERQKRLQAELAAIPQRIAATEEQLRQAHIPLTPWEVTPRQP